MLRMRSGGTCYMHSPLEEQHTVFQKKYCLVKVSGSHEALGVDYRWQVMASVTLSTPHSVSLHTSAIPHTVAVPVVHTAGHGARDEGITHILAQIMKQYV